jgi:hypothetical protein
MKMNENELIPENSEAETEENEKKTETPEAIQTEEASEENENTNAHDGEATEEENILKINAESFAKTLANPMFAVFARGRSGGIEEAVRDFEKMLEAGRGYVSEEDLMKMTPGAYSALGGTPLSARQREIARKAGMSYREYYEIISTIPTKTK